MHESATEFRLGRAILAVRVELLGMFGRVFQPVPSLAMRAFNPKRVQPMHFHRFHHLTATDVIGQVAGTTDVMSDAGGAQRTGPHGSRTSSVIVATMPLGKV